MLHAICGTSFQSHQLQPEASVQCTHLADASIVCERGALQSLGSQVRCLEKFSPGLWRYARGAGLLGWALRVLGIDLSDASVDDWGGLSGELYRWRDNPLAASSQRHLSIVYGQMCCIQSLSAMNYGVQSMPLWKPILARSVHQRGCRSLCSSSDADHGQR